MPERERVAGMQAAVDELVHRADVQVAERVELLHAAEVEERVALDRHRRHATARRRTAARRERRRACPTPAGPRRRATRTGARRARRRRARTARARSSVCTRNTASSAGASTREPPHRCRGRAAQPQRPRDERARDEQHERRGDESQPEPDALRGEQPRHPEERQRKQEDRSGSNAPTECPHARSIRRRAHGVLARRRARHRARAAASRAASCAVPVTGASAARAAYWAPVRQRRRAGRRRRVMLAPVAVPAPPHLVDSPLGDAGTELRLVVHDRHVREEVDVPARRGGDGAAGRPPPNRGRSPRRRARPRPARRGAATSAAPVTQSTERGASPRDCFTPALPSVTSPSAADQRRRETPRRVLQPVRPG